MIPTEVLERLKSELLDWQKLGTSAFEISHRGKDYLEKIITYYSPVLAPVTILRWCR